MIRDLSAALGCRGRSFEWPLLFQRRAMYLVHSQRAKASPSPRVSLRYPYDRAPHLSLMWQNAWCENCHSIVPALPVLGHGAAPNGTVGRSWRSKKVDFKIYEKYALKIYDLSHWMFRVRSALCPLGNPQYPRCTSLRPLPMQLSVLLSRWFPTFILSVSSRTWSPRIVRGWILHY